MKAPEEKVHYHLYCKTSEGVIVVPGTSIEHCWSRAQDSGPMAKKIQCIPVGVNLEYGK